MTGKDLIIYILQNNLEDELVFDNGKFIGFITIREAAVKLNVGMATVCALINRDKIDHVSIDGGIYIPGNFELKNGEQDD